MDGQCYSTIPSYFNTTCELLHDVEEPSLSSLDESIASGQDSRSPVKEESYSDGEALHNIMTSTPQKMTDKRRSVSLMDVSKIDAFTSRPLGNMLASWETIGSQSSVGKSRDSGYVHSGSLLSVNSAKLSETKGGSDQVNTILEECTRLKRELEYSEVLINTLQESNNELRMKCAAAHNRISELRLKCVNHCDCCSHQYSRETSKHNALSDKVFLASSDSSSSSDSSRSPSPEPRPHSRHVSKRRNNTFFEPTSKVDVFLESKEESSSDESTGSPGRVWPEVSSYLTPSASQNHLMENRMWTSESSLFHSNWKSESNQNEGSSFKSSNFARDNQSSRISHEVTENKSYYDKPMEKLIETPSESKTDNIETEEYQGNNIIDIEPYQKTSAKSKNSVKNVFLTLNDKIIEEAPAKYSKDVERKPISSIEDLLENVVEEEKQLPENKPVFVAREMNGKMCVGNFQVWGDTSDKVPNKSPLLTQTSSTIKVRSLTPSFEAFNFEPKKEMINLPFANGVEMRMSVTSPASHCNRPVSVNMSFPNSPELPNRARQISLSNHSLSNNQAYKTSYPQMFQNLLQNVSSKRDSLNITVTSKFDRNQFYNRNSQESTTVKRSNSSLFCEDSKSPLKNDSLSVKSVLPNSTVNSCQENLSNLGVSVTKKESKSLYTDSLVDGWKSVKSKLEKFSLSYLISNDSSEKSKAGAKCSENVVSTPEKNKSQANDSKPLVRVSEQNSLASSGPHDSCKDNNSQHNSENFQECLDKASELARELSRCVARLPPRLEYIQNIGKP